MKKNKKIKICFAASTGGHLEQITRIYDVGAAFDYFLVTNKNKTIRKKKNTTIFINGFSNRNFFLKFINLLINTTQAFLILLFKKPNIIVSTGSGDMFPLLWLGKKLFHKKIIFIESFAKTKTPNKCGQKVYNFADVFIVQWENMLSVYPNAIFIGGIY